MLEQVFKLGENKTNVRTEVVAGITTFLTMAYIVVVNPAILSNAGMPAAAVAVATCLAAAFGSAFMGLYANYPIALAPGMGINAFFLAARKINPDLQVKIVWVNSWFDPPKETEGAQSLLNQGADVLFQNTDSAAVLQTAEKAGKYAFGWDSDMSQFGPKAHLASSIIHWAPYYIKATKDALEGTWKTGGVWWGVKEGAIDIVAISDKVPAELKAKVEAAKAGLKDGSFAIWKGPIAGQDGKDVLPKDTVADDKFLGGINFYVKGVEGAIPSGK